MDDYGQVPVIYYLRHGGRNTQQQYFMGVIWDRPHKKKYQVFISSTYEDLKEERAAVSKTLLDLGCIPIGMEQFPASGMSQMEYIVKILVTCDYYILILAGRYGSIDPTDGIGYTEKEYDYAVTNGIPVMSFIIDDIGKLPIEKCEEIFRRYVQVLSPKISTGLRFRRVSRKKQLQEIQGIKERTGN